MNHTPGPWELGPAGFEGNPPYVNIYQEGDDDDALFIGTVGAEEVDEETAEANARLIAAAPELLQACQTMLKAYRLIPVPDCITEQEQDEYAGLESARKNLINAVAKANVRSHSRKC